MSGKITTQASVVRTVGLVMDSTQWYLMFTCPVGWLLGSVVGSGIALMSNDVVKPQHPFLISILIVVGGTSAIPIPGMILIMVFVSIIGLIVEWFKRQLLG